MAFVCPKKEESEAITHLSNNLKQALHEADKQLTVQVKPICIPVCVPLCDYPQNEKHHEKKPKKFKTPNVMVCYKEPHKSHHNKHHKSVHEESVIRLHHSKSRELRASILYTGCLCEKRDGLQDNCPRTGCHGSPECLTNPPTCGPSEFCDGKHLGKKTQHHRSKLDNGAVKGKHHNHHDSVKYKCFAATIGEPHCLCPQ